MEIKMIEPMTLYVLIGGVLVIFIGLGLRQLESLQKTVPLWLWSCLAGIMIGGGAAFAAHKVESARVESQYVRFQPVNSSSRPAIGESTATGGPTAGGGNPGGGRGGPGSAAGSSSAPRARRDLTALVGKLALLTRGLHLNLDAEQRAKLASAIEAIDKDDEMTEEGAQQHLDVINAILTPENADLLASIDLPRAGRAGAPAGQGMPAGPNGLSAAGAMPRPPQQGSGAGPVSTGQLSAAGAAGGPPGSGTPSNENPFKQDDNAKRLNRLREQINAP
jgi:hypothetical protein